MDDEQRHYDEVVSSMRHYYSFFHRTVLDRMHRHHTKVRYPAHKVHRAIAQRSDACVHRRPS